MTDEIFSEVKINQEAQKSSHSNGFEEKTSVLKFTMIKLFKRQRLLKRRETNLLKKRKP